MKNLAILAVAVASVGAHAVLFETEPNNTPGTANFIARGASPWADVGVMSLNPAGDVDWFIFDMNAGEYLTAITYPIADDTENNPDTMMALWDSNLNQLDFDDDANGFGSAIRYHNVETGRYYLSITGFGDDNFTGDHSEQGDYILTMSLVPEPATMIALAAGIAAIAARRRRK